MIPDDELVAAMQRELDAYRHPLTVVMRPGIALQLALLLYLALRHPSPNENARRAARFFIDHVTLVFEDNPAIVEVLRRARTHGHGIPPPDEEDPRLYDAARDACHATGMPWTDPRTGITHPPPLVRPDPPMRIRYRLQGGHVHCSFFVGRDGQGAKAGELTFNAEEWPTVRDLLASPWLDLIDEDDPT